MSRSAGPRSPGRRTRVCTGTLPFSGFPLGSSARAGQPRAALTCGEITAPRIVEVSPRQAVASVPAEETLGSPSDRYPSPERSGTNRGAGRSHRSRRDHARRVVRHPARARLPNERRRHPRPLHGAAEPHPARRVAIGPHARRQGRQREAARAAGAERRRRLPAPRRRRPRRVRPVQSGARVRSRRTAVRVAGPAVVVSAPRPGQHHQLPREPVGVRVASRACASAARRPHAHPPVAPRAARSQGPPRRLRHRHLHHAHRARRRSRSSSRFPWSRRSIRRRKATASG